MYFHLQGIFKYSFFYRHNLNPSPKERACLGQSGVSGNFYRCNYIIRDTLVLRKQLYFIHPSAQNDPLPPIFVIRLSVGWEFLIYQGKRPTNFQIDKNRQNKGLCIVCQ